MSWAAAAGTAGLAFLGSGVATTGIQAFFKSRDGKSRLKRERVDAWQRGIERLKDFNYRDEHEQYSGPDFERNDLIWEEALDFETQAWFLDYKTEASDKVKTLAAQTNTGQTRNVRARALVAAIMPDINRIRREWKV